MVLEERLGQEVRAAGMPRPRHEAHLRRHRTVGGFALHGAAGIVCTPLPFLPASRRSIDVPAKRSLVGLFWTGICRLETIEVIAKKMLRHVHLNLSLGLPHQFFPA